MSGFYASDPFDNPFDSFTQSQPQQANVPAPATYAPPVPTKPMAEQRSVRPTPVGAGPDVLHPQPDMPQQTPWQPMQQQMQQQQTFQPQPMMPMQPQPQAYATSWSTAPSQLPQHYAASPPPQPQPVQPQPMYSQQHTAPQNPWGGMGQSPITIQTSARSPTPSQASEFDPIVPARSPVPLATSPAPRAATTTQDDWSISWDFADHKKTPTSPPEEPVREAPKAKPSTTPTGKQAAPLRQQAGVISPTKELDDNPQGVCLARVSTRSIFVREWKPCFWVIVNHRLWIYRSRADYNPMDYLHDPFSERIKKSFHLRDNLRATEMKSKVYPGEVKTLYTFGLEYLDEDGGKELMAKFAAYEYDQVRYLREELDRRLFEERHVKKAK